MTNDGHSISNPVHGSQRSRRLTYFGHVTRMEQDRLSYILLHGYTHGVRGKRRPKKRRTDNIRDDCMGIGISKQEASHIATDRER